MGSSSTAWNVMQNIKKINKQTNPNLSCLSTTSKKNLYLEGSIAGNKACSKETGAGTGFWLWLFTYSC